MHVNVKSTYIHPSSAPVETSTRAANNTTHYYYWIEVHILLYICVVIVCCGALTSSLRTIRTIAQLLVTTYSLKPCAQTKRLCCYISDFILSECDCVRSIRPPFDTGSCSCVFFFFFLFYKQIGKIATCSPSHMHADGWLTMIIMARSKKKTEMNK